MTSVIHSFEFLFFFFFFFVGLQILAWQSRGCLPVAIEVTSSIIEIQQRDPHFR
jgi:hypothetical protein